MYWHIALGFLIASLVQAGVIISAEALGISALGAQITAGQLVIHVLAGQAAGFLLMVVMQVGPALARGASWLVGGVYGLVVWAALIPINAAQGIIAPPWRQGAPTLAVTAVAFALYGMIAHRAIVRERRILRL